MSSAAERREDIILFDEGGAQEVEVLDDKGHVCHTCETTHATYEKFKAQMLQCVRRDFPR